MLCRKVFSIVEKSEWDNVDKMENSLREIEAFSQSPTTLYSATAIQKYLKGNAGKLLLCIEPSQIDSFGYEREGITLIDISYVPLSCVEGIYELPIDEKGVSGLPPIYDSIFIGQELDDFVEKLPTVPAAKDVDIIIPELMERASNALIDKLDLVKCIEEAINRIEFETLSKDSLLQIDQCIINCWLLENYEFYDVVSVIIASHDLPKSKERFLDMKGIINKDIIDLVKELCDELNWVLVEC